MDLHLQQKVILINSHAPALLQPLARLLVREGAILVFTGKESVAVTGSHLAEQEGSNAEFIAADLHDQLACRLVLSKVVARHGSVYGLINHTAHSVLSESGGYTSFLEILENELVPYFNLTQAAIPFLKPGRGVILNLCNECAGDPSLLRPSAGAWRALTREWAVELVPYTIRVNALIEAGWKMGDTAPAREEMAASAAFLLSGCSSHTTGQLIYQAIPDR